MGCCESKVQDVNHEAIKKAQRNDLNNYSRNNKLELQKDLNKQQSVIKKPTEPKEEPKRNIFDDEVKNISKDHELNNLNKNNRLELQQDLNKQQSVIKQPTEPNIIVPKEDPKRNTFDDKDKSISKEHELNNNRLELQKDSNKRMVEKPIIVSEEELIEKQELKEVEEWKILIETLLANKKLMAYALAKKNTDFKLVKDVGDYLAGCKEARTIAEKAWLVYVWVTDNIAYDVDYYYNKDYRFCNPQSVLERGLAICGTYSEFYSILCNQIGVKCHVINGFAKGVGYQYGVKMDEKHAWNGIPNLGSGGRMRFIETTWGAGCVGNTKYLKGFRPYYFAVPAHALYAKHHPEDFHPNDGTRKSNIEEFDNCPNDDIEYYRLGLKCVNNVARAVTKTNKNPLVIEYTSHERLIIMATLKEEDSGNEIKCAITCQRELSVKKDKKSKYCIIIHIPKKEKRYNVVLFAHNKDDPNSKNVAVTDFAVIRFGDEENLNIPKYNLTFDYGLKLNSHSCQFIRFKTNPFVMKYEIPKDVQVGFYVNRQDETEIENGVVIRKLPGDSETTVLIALPNQNERFFLNIFAKYSNSDKDSQNYFNQLCLIRTSSDKNDQLTFCRIYDDFDKFGLNCITDGVEGITKTKKNPIAIEYDSFQRLNFGAYLKEENTDEEIKNAIVAQTEYSISKDKKSKYCLIIHIPKKEKRYNVFLFAHNKDDPNSKNVPVTDFAVVRLGDEENLNIPQYNLTFDYGLKLTSHFSRLIKSKTNPLVIELDSFQKLNILSCLKEENTDEEIKNATVSQTEYSISKDKKSKYCFIIHIPKKEKRYKVILYAQNKDDLSSKNNPYLAVTDFAVVRLGDEENLNIPKYNLTFDYGIKLTSHFSRLIKFETNPLTIEFEIPEGVKTGLYVVKEDGKGVDNAIIVQKAPQETKTTAQITLPNRGEKFYLNIFAKYSSDESLVFVGRLDLIREQSNKNDGLKLCLLHSDSTFIHSPIEYYLSWNKPYEFNYFIKDALDVALTNSSNKWFHFKKELDNNWRLKTTLSTKGKLSIWAKFKEGASSFDAISSYLVK